MSDSQSNDYSGSDRTSLEYFPEITIKKILLIVLALTAASAFSQSIPVANYNFTADGNIFPIPCADLPCSYSVGAITAWTTGPGSGQSGLFAPSSAYFNGYNGLTPIAYSNGPTISQTVGATVVAGDTYTLTVDIGDRADCCDYVGGANLTVGDNSYNASGTYALPGNFSVWTATFTGTAADAGDPITINLTTAPGSEQGDFSDVTLTQSVPEGGAAWLYLLLAGAASFGAMLFASRSRLGSRAQA